MTRRRSIAEWRRILSSLVRDAENGKTVEFTRQGERVEVPAGFRESGRRPSGRPGFGNAYREFTSAFELSELSLDSDELFGDVRERDGA